MYPLCIFKEINGTVEFKNIKSRQKKRFMNNISAPVSHPRRWQIVNIWAESLSVRQINSAHI
jgi:hypothetical protein